MMSESAYCHIVDAIEHLSRVLPTDGVQAISLSPFAYNYLLHVFGASAECFDMDCKVVSLCGVEIRKEKQA